MSTRLIALCLATCAAGQAQELENDAPSLAVPSDAASSIGPGSGWLLDLERAKQAAREQGKDILINFSGSDWCPPCIVLEERIFSQDAFIQDFSEDFILLNLDLPRRREKQSKALQAMVDQAIRDYGISAYPTIILTDSQGRPYARTGYKKIELAEYAEHLRGLKETRKERDALLHAAEKATGSEKARRIGEALQALPASDILTFYEPEYRAALASDPQEAGGLQHVVYHEKKSALEHELDRYAENKNWYAVLARIERFLREEEGNLTPAQRQEVEFFKIGSLFHLADFDELERVLNGLVRLDPESQVAQRSKQFLAAVAELRKKAAEMEKAEGGKKEAKPSSPRPGASGKDPADQQSVPAPKEPAALTVDE